MASILKKLRRHCIEHGKEHHTCAGCPFWTPKNCMLREVPADWDLPKIWKLAAEVIEDKDEPL
jgi:hypothetical protein